MLTRTYRTLLALALMTAVLAALRIANLRQMQTEQNRSCGRFTRQQILTRTDPLRHLFVPETTYYTAYSISSPRRDGTLQHTWEVECTDTAEHVVACFSWDADTGDLRDVSLRAPFTVEKTSASLTQSQAVQTCRSWLNTFETTEQAPPWHLALEPEELFYTWAVSWKANRRTAFLVINKRSGYLVYARFR
jgi:hypothetical protein